VAPLRDALASIVRDEVPSISGEMRVFFRDCHDHAVQLVGAIELERERARGLVDLVLAALSNRMNEVMKLLTIIATIFIPLSFIASVYGMNFNTVTSPWNMPELNAYWGYPMALALMAGVALTLLVWFWRKRWIGGD
jgi:magnesium transporter